MLSGDRIFGLFMFLVALGYAASAFQIEAGFLSDPVGSKTFPLIVAGVAMLCSLLMVLRPDPDPEWPPLATWGALAFAAVVLVGYTYALKPLGFLIPTAVASGILSYQIARQPVFAVASGLGLSVGLFAIFRFVLGLSLVPFPKSWMGG